MIAVFGASGFVGRYLIDLLAARGESVLIIGRKHKLPYFENYKDYRYIQIDFNDVDCLDQLEKFNISACVNLSALIPASNLSGKDSDYFNANTLNTLKILEFCKNQGVKKHLMITTLYEVLGHAEVRITEDMGRRFSYNDDHSAYVISKIAGSDLSRMYSEQFNFQNIILRFTGLLGFGRQEGYWSKGKFHKSAFETFYTRSKNAMPLEVWGEHTAVRDSLYVKDAVQAIYMALSSDSSGIYNIGSGIGRTNYEDALAFSRTFHKEGRHSEIVFKPEIPEKGKSYILDSTRAKEAFNWAPSYNYEQILIDYDLEVKREYFSKVH